VVVGTRSRAIGTPTSNEDCEAKTSPAVREKGRRNVQRRIAQERVPTTIFQDGELIFIDCRVVSAPSLNESILCRNTKV
jgi:hypothetical protein